MSIDGSSGRSDLWTGMPLEDDDLQLDAQLLSPPAPARRLPLQAKPEAEKRKPSWNLADRFWKSMAARSATTSSTILCSLATDESASVRKRVAENPRCPAQALILLAEDADSAVRAAVAQNRVTPTHLLRQLSADESASVRLAIATNDEMPDAILLSLFLDPDPSVADRASQTLAG